MAFLGIPLALANKQVLCFQTRSTLHGSSVLHHLIVWQLDKRHLRNFIHGDCTSGVAISYILKCYKECDTILTVSSSLELTFVTMS